jgi:glycosyltransferase involved in cell wall biosynthesis
MSGTCLVATVPSVIRAFMVPHIQAVSALAPVTVVSTAAEDALADLGGPNVVLRSLDIPRQIAPLRDAMALLRLVRLFRRERYAAVVSITPKAGLLAMMAAWLTGVPVRLHWFTGQVWATRSGLARRSLRLLDRVLAESASHLLADSPSQRDFLEAEGVAAAGRITVLGAGSVGGVNTVRFQPSSVHRTRIRAEFGIPADALLVVYLGRLNPEKGVPELTAAFAHIADERPELHLLLVGPDEAGMRTSLQGAAGTGRVRVHSAGFTREPEAVMAAADIFVLPSHREGFGASVIEAAACGVPAVGTRIYGLVDAIAEGESGMLVPVGDPAALGAAILGLAGDAEARRAMGMRARRRVEREFTEARMTALFMTYFEDALAEANPRNARFAKSAV